MSSNCCTATPTLLAPSAPDYILMTASSPAVVGKLEAMLRRSRIEVAEIDGGIRFDCTEIDWRSRLRSFVRTLSFRERRDVRVALLTIGDDADRALETLDRVVTRLEQERLAQPGNVHSSYDVFKGDLLE